MMDDVLLVRFFILVRFLSFAGRVATAHLSTLCRIFK